MHALHCTKNKVWNVITIATTDFETIVPDMFDAEQP